jgi:hypothetical protein
LQLSEAVDITDSGVVAKALHNKNRTATKLVGPTTIAITPARMPQVIMIRPIHGLGADFFHDQVAGNLEEEAAAIKSADVRLQGSGANGAVRSATLPC